MDHDEIRLKAIDAAKRVLGREIVIQSDADFTPPGKRSFRVVQHTFSGRRAKPHLRWYVGQKSFRSLALTGQNQALSREWQAAGQ